MKIDKDRLTRCLDPRSIAVVGGKEGEEVIKQSRKLGYQGKIWAINPKRKSMAGIQCMDALSMLPEAPDAVFIGVPAEPAIEMVKILNEMGAGGAVCLASGFKEVGKNGDGRQSRLRQAAQRMPVIGPNCYGYINTLSGAALFPDQHGLARTKSGVAIVSSSGNIGINFTLQQRGLPISWLITIGNQAVVGIEEIMAAALENDSIRAIGLHVEGLNNLTLFIELADAARRKKIPVIVLKAGKSDIGARIAFSHTAALAGESELYRALFDRLGIGSVDTMEEFLEALKLACVTGPLQGNRIASMSCSGGEASLIADLSAGRELAFPKIEPGHKKRLQSTLNEYVAIDNPLDYHTFIWGDRRRMNAAFTAMMSVHYDLTLLIIDFPFVNDCVMDNWVDATWAFIDACRRTHSKGAVVTCLSENFTDEIRELLIENGIAPLHGMDQALAAIETVSKIGRAWRGRWVLPRITPRDSGDADEYRAVSEYDAKKLLRQNNIPVPNFCVVRSMEEIREGLEKIGFPLVVKAVCADVAHKSERNAVVVGITDDNTLNRECERLFRLSEVLLMEEMVSDVVAEMLAGFGFDQNFGHTLTLGFGGTLVELIADSEIVLPPLTPENITAALKKLKTWPLLNGFRGRDLADIDALVDTIIRMSRLVESKSSDIVELEVNPLLVKPKGQGVVAADALIRLGG